MRYTTGIKKSTLKKEESKARIRLKFIDRIRELNSQGFVVPKNPIRKGTRNSVELHLRKMLKRPENKRFIGRLFIKSIPDITKGGSFYTLVLKRKR